MYLAVCLLSNVKNITAGMEKPNNVYARLFKISSHYLP